MNVKKNLKEATKGQSIKDALIGAVFGSVIYTVLPTALKLKGPAAVAVGALSTWGAGAVTGQKGLQVAGFVLPAVHMTYVYGNKVVMEILKRPIYRYDAGGTSTPTLSDTVRFRNEPVLAQVPTDLPAPAEQLMDYNVRQLEGYQQSGAAPQMQMVARSRGSQFAR